MVLALGGNALAPAGSESLIDPGALRRAAEAVVDLYEEGLRIVVTHGNGPQVGYLLERLEARGKPAHARLDAITSMTQGWIGYALQQAIGNAMAARGLGRRVVALVNQVVIDPSDPGFHRPSKPVGPYYSEEEAARLSRERGWAVVRDPRGLWRRAVPSPRPLENVEAEAVKILASAGYVVIASGGGGVPVARAGELLEGVEAVVDKDLASAVLAVELEADGFVILTDVEGIYRGYGRPGAALIRRIRVSEALELLRSGEAPPGSMGPKLEAACIFAMKRGRESRIGSLERAGDVAKGISGTAVLPG